MARDSDRERTIHMSWIIGLLTLLIISLLSSNLGTRNDLKDILSFAVSFASLILAMVAIAQSLLASNSSSSLFNSLSDTFNKIEESTEKFSKIENRLPQDLNEIKNSIEASVGDLADAIENLNTHTMQIQDQQSQIIIQQEAMSRQVHLRSPVQKEDLELGFLTNGQTVALYLCIVANEQDKSFNTSDVMSPEDGQYESGVISTLRTLKAMSIDDVDGHMRVNNLGRFEGRKDRITEMIANSDSELAIENKKKIDKFFSDDETVHTQNENAT